MQIMEDAVKVDLNDQLSFNFYFSEYAKLFIFEVSYKNETKIS